MYTFNSLNQKDNCVYVDVVSEKFIEGIKEKLMNSSFKDIVQAVQYEVVSADSFDTLSTAINPTTISPSTSTSSSSSYLYIGNSLHYGVNGIGTVGLNAMHYENGQRGILTCEHVIGKNTVARDKNGQYINSSFSPNNLVSTTLDASFVPFASSTWQLSSHIEQDGNNFGSILRICTDSNFVEGATVYKFGASSKVSTGTIKSLFSSNEDFPGVYVKTDCYAELGDSGSALLVQAPIMQGRQYEVIGLVRIRYAPNGVFKYSYIVPIKPILFTLDLKPITTTLFYRIGDADGDNIITSTDARLVLQYASGNETISGTYLPSVDVDMNKVIDDTDAKLILQKYAGTLDWLT